MTNEQLRDMQAAIESALKLGDLECYIGLKNKIFVEQFGKFEGR